MAPCRRIFLCFFVTLISATALGNAETHYHEFNVQETQVKRLCRTKNILTVNGQFPGPTLEVRNGDSLVIKVINNAQYNISLHWHGIQQMRTPWADGPEYVTQCPIQPGASYTYSYAVENQEGTLWWHAHSRFLRATVYGPLIIRPKPGVPYPFLEPKKEIPVLLGINGVSPFVIKLTKCEWWNGDINAILQQALVTGAAPNFSDAYTINGQPGDFYRCSSKDTVKFYVNPGDTILFRVINAALHQQLFFTIADHLLTVVGADADYLKPFHTTVVMLGPGQTTDVLLIADQQPARYYAAATAYASAQNAQFDNTTTTAILEYTSIQCHSKTGSFLKPILAQLPAFNDTTTATAFTTQLRSPSQVEVPIDIDENLFFTVGLGLVNCNPGPTCQGPNGIRFAASMNNVSFVFPRRVSLLQAYYNGIPGIFTTDFPPVPPIQFDYTGNVSRALSQPTFGTKLYKLKFSANVQIVLQDTGILSTEDHPIHLHGYSFYIVGQGFGNFNPSTDTSNFNLLDPPRRNTVDVPTGGWVVIRFVSDNPGVWLMHCHIDSHLFWGLAMAFLVENGAGTLQSVRSPPLDLPKC